MYGDPGAPKKNNLVKWIRENVKRLNQSKYFNLGRPSPAQSASLIIQSMQAYDTVRIRIFSHRVAQIVMTSCPNWRASGAPVCRSRAPVHEYSRAFAWVCSPVVIWEFSLLHFHSVEGKSKNLGMSNRNAELQRVPILIVICIVSISGGCTRERPLPEEREALGGRRELAPAAVPVALPEARCCCAWSASCRSTLSG